MTRKTRTIHDDNVDLIVGVIHELALAVVIAALLIAIVWMTR